jgi:chaperonin cofactor prefoldin
MSFEEEKLDEAMKVLQETEKLSDTDSGVFKSIKNRFKSKKKREVRNHIPVHLNTEITVCLSDCPIAFEYRI